MRLLLLVWLSGTAAFLSAAPPTYFEPNFGQTDDRVRYLARSQTGIVFFTDEDGELIVSSVGREIRQHKPAIFQIARDGSRRAVDGGFQLQGRSEIRFVVGPYDRSVPLTIDPVIDLTTYLGGDGDDQAVYSGRESLLEIQPPSISPRTTPSRKKSSKIFYQAERFTLIAGGSGDDRLTAVLLSALSDVVLVGYTNSTDLATGTPQTTAIVYFRRRGAMVSQTSVAARSASPESRVYVEKFGNVGAVGSIRSGLAVVNTSDSAISTVLELFNLDGTPAGSYQVSISGKVRHILRDGTVMLGITAPD
jgi:hypothetical protein